VEGLTHLAVHVSEYGFSDWGAAVIRAASRLTALWELDLVYVGKPGGDHIDHRAVKLPRCQELAMLRSNSLGILSVSMASGMGDVLHLAGVRNLQECHLCEHAVTTADFRNQSTSFEGCTGLVELTLLHKRGLTLQPECFRALAALTKLTLSSCGLRAVPAQIEQLPALRRLNLRNNPELEVDETGANVLRSLKQLSLLVIAHDAPKVHAQPHTQNLFDLMAISHTEGRQLIVQTNPATAEKTHQQIWAHFGML